MKTTILVILSLFVLSGCESIEWTSVSVGTGYSSYHPHNHISYTLGYYSGSHYNGYAVHGSHGRRYYYAPRNYTRHHYYSQPHYVRPVVHQHVHTSSCYARGGHSYTPPRPRHTPVPNRTPRVIPRQRDNRVDQQDRRDRNDRRGNRRDRDRQHKK